MPANNPINKLIFITFLPSYLTSSVSARRLLDILAHIQIIFNGINVPCIIKYCLLLISIGQFLKVHRAILVLGILLTTHTSQAATFSEWASNEARLFLTELTDSLQSEKGYRSTFDIGNIDPRLNLSACKKPIEFQLQGNPLTRQNNTLKLECNDQKHWSIFVGVSISTFKKVWVASQTLPRNHHISQGDLELREIQTNQSKRDYFIQKNNLVGMKLRRALKAGDIIYPGVLSPPKVVERGDTVVISAISPTISVEMLGTALNDGKLGQQISVKNKKSNRIIRATVVSKGKVSVPM